MNEPSPQAPKRQTVARATRLTAMATNALSNKHGIFICYRRKDSAGIAGRIRDRLVNEFGDAGIFFDVDNIRPGANFIEAIRERVGKVAVVLIVIGRDWHVDPNPSTTLERTHPTDIVRLEAATALAANAHVIPVTVDGAQVPPADKLPPKLKGIAYINALDVSHRKFEEDIANVIDTVRPISGLEKGGKLVGVWALIVGAGLAAAAGGYFLVTRVVASLL